MDENEFHHLNPFARRDRLIEAYFWMVRRAALWAKRRLPVNIEFDDVYQSAFLGLLEAANGFDATRGSSFESYARKRVYGAAIDPFRGRRYKDHTTLPLGVSDARVMPIGDQQLADRDLRSVVARVLRALKPDEQNVIVLRYLSGKDFYQIASHLRIGLSRLRKLHKEALEKLKREFMRSVYIGVRGPGVVERLLLSK